jgi:pilus assembly protein Flp/PilA
MPGAAGARRNGDVRGPWVVRGVRPGNSSTQFGPRIEEEIDIMKNLFARFIKEEEGQDLIEYALLASFVALVVIAGVTILGTTLNTWYTAVGGSVTTAS